MQTEITSMQEQSTQKARNSDVFQLLTKVGDRLDDGTFEGYDWTDQSTERMLPLLQGQRTGRSVWPPRLNGCECPDSDRGPAPPPQLTDQPRVIAVSLQGSRELGAHRGHTRTVTSAQRTGTARNVEAGRPGPAGQLCW